MKKLFKLNKLLFLASFIIFTFILGMNYVAFASTYYVVPSQDWSKYNNSGSIDDPTDLATALRKLKPGDTIFMRGGTYNNFMEITRKNGSPTQWYNVKNYPGEQVVLDGKNASYCGIILTDSSYWNFEGFTLTNFTNIGVYLHSGCHDFTLSNLEISNVNTRNTDSNQFGILGEGNTYNCVVKNCKIHDIGKSKELDHGVYINKNPERWTFDSNLFYNITGAGIHMYGEPCGGKYCTIVNNLIFNNQTWGLVIGSNACNNIVKNNKLFNNAECDIYLTDSSTNNTFEGNVLASINSLYNIGISDNESINNSFDKNIYCKDNQRLVYTPIATFDLSTWQSYSKEPNGTYTNDRSAYIPYNKAYTTKRLSGTSRFDTANEIVNETFTEKVDAVLVTYGHDFQSGVPASVLAQKLNAPLVLACKDSEYNALSLNFIKSHLNSNGKVYILDNVSKIPESFVNELTSAGYSNIVNLYGSNVYETNKNINKEIKAEKGTPVIIASDSVFADSLSISSIASLKGYPIILSNKDTLSKEAAETLRETMPSKIYIAGGTGAISDEVKNKISSLVNLKDENIVRFNGSDRYDTSLKIAKHFNLNSEFVTFAYGENFADTLTGNILAAKLNAPIILVNNDVSNQKSYVDNTKSLHQIIFGGTGIISKETEYALSR